MKIDTNIINKRNNPFFTPKKLQTIKEITKIKLEEKKGNFFSKLAIKLYKKLFK